MAIKFNKELMLKHRFWIMLGVTIVLALGGITYLETCVDAEAARKPLQTLLIQTKMIVTGKSNPDVLNAIKKVTEHNKKNEADIWSAAYRAQEPLFRWPEPVEKKFNFTSGYFATDIKLSKLPDAKTPWPKDSEIEDKWEKLVHGTLDVEKDQEEHGFYLNRSGYFATEIKVSKLDAKNPWPRDIADKDKKEKVIHGTLEGETDQNRHGFYLKPAKGDNVLIRPMRTDAEIITLENGKRITLGEFKKKDGADKLLTVTYTDRQKVLICPMQTDTEIVTLENTSKKMFGKLKEHSAGKLLAVTYQEGRYFNDPLVVATEQAEFADSYSQQIHKILKLVDPLDEKGNGVVQLKDWLYKPFPEFPPVQPKVGFIRWVPDPPGWIRNKSVYKEAWIAQEDLWIQKEIYRMIADANNKISDFQGTGGDKKDKTYYFANPNFKVELILDAKGTLSFTIKNRLDHQQALDLNFRVQLNKETGPEVFRISGLPLKPAGDKLGKDSFTPEPFKIDRLPRNGIFSVQQVLTWQTAAVKRIDQISIGDAEMQSHSHRTFGDAALRPFDPKDMEGAVAVKGVGRPAAGPKLPFPPKKLAAPVAMGANMGGIEHDLWTFRYVGGVGPESGVTAQFRRIPVAVVLIVDQDHVDRVLTSFNNSKLRFLPTQVLLNQYPGSLQPPAAPQPDGDKLVRPPLPGPRPGPIGGPAPPQGGGASDTEMNMELVIYGFMTLYQRYPPAPPRGVVAVEKK